MLRFQTQPFCNNDLTGALPGRRSALQLFIHGETRKADIGFCSDVRGVPPPVHGFGLDFKHAECYSSHNQGLLVADRRRLLGGFKNVTSGPAVNHVVPPLLKMVSYQN